MFSLAGKTALVTGAGSGIGQAIAEVFAQAGAQVFVADIDLAKAGSTVKNITDAGGHARSVMLDVASEASFAEALKAVPSVDILVANAGIGHVGTVLTTATSDLDRLYTVNVRGVFLTMKTWLPGMVERGRGSIILMASTAGVEGLVDRLAYSMTKHAVVGLGRSAALDHAKCGVRINCVAPGRVETPFVTARLAEYPDPEVARREMSSTQPIGRMGLPSEVAHAVLFLASDESSFVTGSVLAVDGGWTAGMFPKG
ncbi:MAG TPA: glucose 1-dehydrogenase [Candidatus Limnocylindria bacterium]|jgi:NAD(P)-dependent dehydrogenase (short-subunit alcohol dehydrogenase family)|nr:glucose 1-dehydrogenase [Candidatus Limnocylindria bacterium]